MSILVKAVIAVVLGVLTAGLLNYFGVLNHSLNSLIGFLVALLFFFGYDRLQ